LEVSVLYSETNEVSSPFRSYATKFQLLQKCRHR
jgi:hypothetical protein